jgi:hypothetical protein
VEEDGNLDAEGEWEDVDLSIGDYLAHSCLLCFGASTDHDHHGSYMICSTTFCLF